jgi:Icc-related predicted phosphoesterase
VKIEAQGIPEPAHATTLRIAAAGDIHCGDEPRPELVEAFARLQGDVDLVLLAGDLSTHGEPSQARTLADACRGVDLPIVAVLGNHDWHAGRHDEFTAVLEESGIRVLDRGWTICEFSGIEVGIAGTKGFVGGFPGSHLPDFGEPLLREVYAEATAEVDALHAALRAIDLCPFRIVLLHYAPICETLEGERREIWSLLGTDRLAAPIAEHDPDLVLHGHAHGGRFQGVLGEVPVFNVSVPVMGQDFWIFELKGAPRAAAHIH